MNVSTVLPLKKKRKTLRLSIRPKWNKPWQSYRIQKRFCRCHLWFRRFPHALERPSFHPPTTTNDTGRVAMAMGVSGWNLFAKKNGKLTAGTWEYILGRKETSSSKPSCLSGSMLNFEGVTFEVFWINFWFFGIWCGNKQFLKIYMFSQNLGRTFDCNDTAPMYPADIEKDQS